MSIEILSTEVVDQIAAGEVVERPAHMVKELVENSIDAGATEISVEFSQGGRSVRIIDNGSGMDPVDLPKSFLRFATSKIKESDDLWRLASFGFRGEALASIGSVSKMTIFSSSNDSGTGQRVSCHFGKISGLEPVSRSRGTTVIVEDLFQNVPARLKFMKGDAAEAAQIKQIVKALALAHPHVDFRVTQEGKLLYFWPASDDLKKRVENILDIAPLYEGQTLRGSVRARAFFTDPHQVARVSKNLWFFAQHRYVQDRALQAAVMEAYRNLLMHGEYPYVVCFLETDPAEIDVNIHPTKSQVKFLNPQNAFRAVQGAIRSVLEKAPWLSSHQTQNHEGSGHEGAGAGEPQAEPLYIPSSSGMNSVVNAEANPKAHPSADPNATTNANPNANANPNPNTKPPSQPESKTAPSYGQSPPLAKNIEFDDPAFRTSFFRQKSQIQRDDPIELIPPPMNEYPMVPREETEGVGAAGASVSLSLKSSGSSSVAEKPLIRHWSLLNVIGQAGLTYIVAQNEKGLVLIDQHAAHERVAFERLMNAWKKGILLPVQNFLFPLAIDLSEEKVEALRPYFEEFAKMGIEIEELGPMTLGVKSAPQLLKDRVIVQEIERIAVEVTQWGDSALFEKAIGDICARLACHSVLRAGQSLSREEMVRLLEEMDEYPLSCFCPHGRPVSVNYSWPELEKDFGRRV